MTKLLQRLSWITLGALLGLWQLVALAPLDKCRAKSDKFITRWKITASALVKWLVLVLVTPVLLRLSMALYGATNVSHTSLFTTIALLTMASDLVISLVLLIASIYHRRRLAVLLNGLMRLRSRKVQMRWPHMLLLWVKLLLSWYELLCNIPFFRRMAGRLPWPRVVAYVMQLYVQHLSSIFGNGVLAVLLLMHAGFEQLHEEWKLIPIVNVDRLLRHERRLLRLCDCFLEVFQLGMFLVLIGQFINILGNLYSMMDYFAQQHGVPLTMSNYCVVVTLELYALVLSAHLCNERHASVRRRCTQYCYVPSTMTKEEASKPTPILVLPVPIKLSILGLFTLDHAFWLVLVSYAVNFIVLILQFTMERIGR